MSVAAFVESSQVVETEFEPMVEKTVKQNRMESGFFLSKINKRESRVTLKFSQA